MERAEVIKLVDLIQLHRPYFRTRLGEGIYKDLINEWERIMGPYEYKDIYNNLEKFLKDEDNYGKEPDAYQLIRGLLTIEDKKEGNNGQVQCMFCSRVMSRLEIHKHEDRCRSIKYITKLYKRYLKRELADKRVLYDMDDKEFNEKYIHVLEKVYPFITNITEKRSMSNVIETYYGREPKYTINEVYNVSNWKRYDT